MTWSRRAGPSGCLRAHDEGVNMSGRGTQTYDPVVRRSCSLVGPDTKKAVEAGFDDAEWYRAPIDADRLKVLMVRRNGRPALDAVLWLALLGGAGTLAFFTLGTWWTIPAFAAFGALWAAPATPAGTRTDTARPSAAGGRTTLCTTSRRS